MSRSTPSKRGRQRQRSRGPSSPQGQYSVHRRPYNWRPSSDQSRAEVTESSPRRERLDARSGLPASPKLARQRWKTSSASVRQMSGSRPSYYIRGRGSDDHIMVSNNHLEPSLSTAEHDQGLLSPPGTPHRASRDRQAKYCATRSFDPQPAYDALRGCKPPRPDEVHISDSRLACTHHQGCPETPTTDKRAFTYHGAISAGRQQSRSGRTHQTHPQTPPANMMFDRSHSSSSGDDGDDAMSMPWISTPTTTRRCRPSARAVGVDGDSDVYHVTGEKSETIVEEETWQHAGRPADTPTRGKMTKTDTVLRRMTDPQLAVTINRLINGHGTYYGPSRMVASGCREVAKKPAPNGYVNIHPASDGSREDGEPRAVKVHRLMAQWSRKICPDLKKLYDPKYEVSHLCGNRLCIEESHLRLETCAINRARRECHRNWIMATKGEGETEKIVWCSSWNCRHEPSCLPRLLPGSKIRMRDGQNLTKVFIRHVEGQLAR